MKVRCLLLGARRRVYFINKLKEYLNENYSDNILLYSDVDDLDPARFSVDKFCKLPPSDESDFFSKLSDLVQAEQINLIIPWNDKDILNLNKVRHELSDLGVKLALPDIERVNLFNDKFLTTKWAKDNDIPYPETLLLEKSDKYEAVKLKFPVVVKPRFGQGSLGVETLNNHNEFMTWQKSRNEDFLVQEFIGGTEYTVDMCQSGNHIVFLSPRKRIKVRGGECLISKIEESSLISKLALKISQKVNLSGIYNFQVITNGKDISLIEFNPRFGGGSDLTIEAGGNIPKYLIEIYLREKEFSDKVQVKNNLIMSRYFSAEFFDG